MKQTKAITLTAAILLSVSSINVYALPQYTLLDLGAGNAVGINASGQVAYNAGNSAYITGANGVGATNIGNFLGGSTTRVTAINDSGQLVGYTDGSTFITGANGVGMKALVTASGAQFSNPQAINAVGQVAGFSVFQNTGTYEAFITGPNGVGLTGLGTLGGASSTARGINASGQVVGSSDSAPGDNAPTHAFITGVNGVGITDLGTLGGSVSSATAVNANGQVIGQSSLPASSVSTAFITGANGVGMTDLGSLPGGTHDTIAWGINSSGQVVGYANVGSIVNGPHSISPLFHAFVTGPNGVGITDLNSLVELSEGVYLTEAIGINDLGQIVVNDSLGHVNFLTISSVPVPATGLLFGSGLLGFITAARRKFQAA